MAFSATYSPAALDRLAGEGAGGWLTDPHRVMLCEQTVGLAGVRHFFLACGPPRPAGAGAEEEGAAGAGPAAPSSSAAAATADGDPDEGDPDGSGSSAAREAAVAAEEAAEAAVGGPATRLERLAGALLQVVAGVAFHQAVVFAPSAAQAEALALRLTARGFPAAYIAGAAPQAERLAALRRARAFRCRVLVSTDLTARGVDLTRVNLVPVLCVPTCPAQLPPSSPPQPFLWPTPALPPLHNPHNARGGRW